ncbi:hypothetical protein P43SY_012137 [Pythium insidiosum]|uniref:Uncharacterized protein n=1 Tax=Pythium insidiosum TaxID=114742 RepID=A0AAD5LQX4_PYTIN|nr:hypothetical protein P43SY_012137 [Pythium insidiosum]
MAQGKNYLKKGTSKVKNAAAKPAKKQKNYSHKLSSNKFTRKGNPTRLQRIQEAWWQGGDGLHQPQH